MPERRRSAPRSAARPAATSPDSATARAPACQASRPAERPGARPVGAGLEDDQVRPVGQRVRRAGHRLDREAPPPLALRGACRRCRSAARATPRRRRARARPSGPRSRSAGPAVVVPLQVGERRRRRRGARSGRRPRGTGACSPVGRPPSSVQRRAGGHGELGAADSAVLVRADVQVRVHARHRRARARCPGCAPARSPSSRSGARA